MTVTIQIHKVPSDVYDRLDVEEMVEDEHRWKTITTPEASVTFFPAKDPA